MDDFIDVIPDLNNEMISPPTSGTTTVLPVFSTGGLYISKFNTLKDEDLGLLITENPDICQGKAIIFGTRISVVNIVELYHILGWDVQKIQDEYLHLAKEQILAALEYYESHQSEIDRYLKEEKETEET